MQIPMIRVISASVASSSADAILSMNSSFCRLLSCFRVFAFSWRLSASRFRVFVAVPFALSWPPSPHSDLPSAVRAHVDRVAIRVEQHGAVLVGTENLAADFVVALQHVRRGVSEGVVAAGAHDRDARREAIEEGSGARRQAAVMRHFQDSNSGWLEAGTDRLLRFAADVAGQDDRDVAPADLEDDRV